MKAAIALVVVIGGGCTTDRVSDSYKCTTNTDCDATRVCDMGYCVIGTRSADARVEVCPDICAGACDFTTHTCTITGSGGRSINCPTGWDCTIACTSPGACGPITCASSNCVVQCSGANACGNLTCQTGDCTRTCTGPGACGSLTCGTGDCAQTCSGGVAACGSLTCGTGKCESTCQGVDPACEDVTCSASCGCQVNCDDVANTCPINMLCRTSGNGANQKYCSDTGLMGDTCTFTGSGGITGCNTCP